MHSISRVCFMKFFYIMSSDLLLLTYVLSISYSPTYHSRATDCLQKIRGTDYLVFVFIRFPQMSNILLLKSVTMTHPQISNEILCPYCRRYRDCSISTLYLSIYQRNLEMNASLNVKDKSSSLFNFPKKFLNKLYSTL